MQVPHLMKILSLACVKLALVLLWGELSWPQCHLDQCSHTLSCTLSGKSVISRVFKCPFSAILNQGISLGSIPNVPNIQAVFHLKIYKYLHMDWVNNSLLIIFLAHHYHAQNHEIHEIHGSYATCSESDFDRSWNCEWFCLKTSIEMEYL